MIFVLNKKLEVEKCDIKLESIEFAVTICDIKTEYII